MEWSSSTYKSANIYISRSQLTEVCQTFAMYSLMLLVALFAGAHSQCTPTLTKVGGRMCGKLRFGETLCSGQLIFEDNFDTLDFDKWEHERTLAGGGNWEFQWYDNNRRNSFVKNGILYVKPSLTTDEVGNLYGDTVDLHGGSPADACTNPSNYGCVRTGTGTHVINPVKSASIRSINSCFFKYGRLVVRAKMPAGDWLWPAVWLLPRHNVYGGWPRSGEIDLLESRGNKNLVQNGKNIGTQLVGSTLNWGPDYNNNRYEMTHWEKTDANGFDVGFHDYEMIWTPDGFTFKVDNVTIGTVSPPSGGFWQHGGFSSSLFNPWQNQDKMAPFNQKFYVLINSAVGGTAFFPDNAENPSPKPWKNNSPRAASDFWEGRNNWLSNWNLGGSDNAALQIDFVRIYAL